jgi:hypothetical protein
MFTLTHKQNIIAIMLKTTAEYIDIFVSTNPDADCYDMYANDIAYNTSALNDFVESEDYAQLHTAIIRQDTLVREYYYAVLVYIEQNALIPKRKFACI